MTHHAIIPPLEHSPTQPNVIDLASRGEVEVDPAALPIPKSPSEAGKWLRKSIFTAQDGAPLLAVRGEEDEYMRYTGAKCWQVTSSAHIDLKLRDAVEKGYVQEDGPGNPYPTTKRALGELRYQVGLSCLLPEGYERGTTTWLPKAPEQLKAMKAEDILPLKNGLLHLPSRKLLPHSPWLFCDYCLSYDYIPEAKAPRFEQFLNQIFAHSPTSKDLLQEFFYYVLTGDTSAQKFLLIIGPPRAGKGIISKILKDLLGTSRTASPKLVQFSQNFGLEPLVGKQLAIVEDARSGAPAEQAKALETILNVTGGDQVQIDRKHRRAWQGVLNTRIMINTNEIPRFVDSTSAFTSRMKVIQLKESFVGKENPGLAKELLAELPGILAWALQAQERYEAHGFTTTPEEEEVKQRVADLANPVVAFMKESYTRAEPENTVALDDLFNEYQQWCFHANMTACNKTDFKEQLTGAGYKPQRLRPTTGRRYLAVKGIRKCTSNFS